jgi:hypothetical protein
MQRSIQLSTSLDASPVQWDYLLGLRRRDVGLERAAGTAEATGLSNPSLLTDETPNTQSSTRM